MTESPPDPLVKQLKRMRHTANLQSTAHSWLRDFYGRWNLRFTISALLVSAFLLPLVLVSDEFIQRTTGLSADAFKWITAIRTP